LGKSKTLANSKKYNKSQKSIKKSINLHKIKTIKRSGTAGLKTKKLKNSSLKNVKHIKSVGKKTTSYISPFK